jgi:hypothetical protein
MTKHKSPRPKSILQAILTVISAGAVGYFVGNIFVNLFTLREIARRPDILSLLGMFVFAIFLVILTHEIGHLLGGKIAGMQPILMIVGPFQVNFTKKGVQFSINTNLGFAGGLAACMPTNTRDINRQFLLLIMGGPLSSLLSGMIGLTLYLTLPTTTLLPIFFLIFGLIALVIFVVTMIPAQSSGFMTDGAQMLALWRGGTEIAKRNLMVTIHAQSMQGTRPRDYSPEIVAQALEPCGNPLYDAAAQVTAYAHHLDNGDIERAKNHLQTALEMEENASSPMGKIAALEYAFLLAATENDALNARTHFQKSTGALTEKSAILRTEAAVLWAEGKMDEARKKAGQALHHYRRALDVGTATAESDWIARYLPELVLEPQSTP